MGSMMVESLIILILTGLACSGIGCFLILRGDAMLADALSHSILLGVVLAYFWIGQLDGFWLKTGASIMGLIVVLAVEQLGQRHALHHQQAIGLVYPLFFALAIVLISIYGRNIHLDMDAVLLGQVVLSPLNRITVFGHSLPRAYLDMGGCFLVNSVFMMVFFKELKVSSFDSTWSQLAGFLSPFLFYGLMTLTAVTTVASFDVVGAILVISFLIAPGASAYLVVKKLKQMLLLASGIAIFNACLGYFLGIYWNVSLAGMTAFIGGITFCLIYLVKQWQTRQLVKKRNNE